MKVRFFFDKAAVERRGHTMEDVHRTVNNNEPGQGNVQHQKSKHKTYPER